VAGTSSAAIAPASAAVGPSPGSAATGVALKAAASAAALAADPLGSYFCDAAAKKVQLKANAQWVHVVP